MSLTPALSRRVSEILGPRLADLIKDASQDPSGAIYVRLEYIKSTEEWRRINAEMMDRLTDFNVTYKDGFYKFKLSADEAAEPKPRLNGQQEIAFTDGTGATVTVPEKLEEEYAGRPIQTGIPKIDEKYVPPTKIEETVKALTYGDIHVNPEYEALLPKQSLEDYERLKANIKRDGLWYPITVNPYGIILDGHNRFKACKEAVVPLRWDIKSFDDSLLEKKFVIESNLNRRHLNDAQKTQLGIPLLAIEEELATKRQAKTRFGGVVNSDLAVEVSKTEDKGRARDIISERIGVKPITFEYAKAVLEKGPQELKDKMLLGEVSISKAYSTITAKPREPTQDRFCPVCGRAVAPSLYEKLKQKFSGFGGLFQ